LLIKVYECERQDGSVFAVKCFDLSFHSKKDDEESLYAKKCYRREVEFLKTLAHPHIVRFEETIVQVTGVPFVVMEKMSCTLLQVGSYSCISIIVNSNKCQCQSLFPT
jgi:hypothetical protein